MGSFFELKLVRTPEGKAVVRKVEAHRQRCKALPPLGEGEAERLVAEFAATRKVTHCAPGFAVAVGQ